MCPMVPQVHAGGWIKLEDWLAISCNDTKDVAVSKIGRV